MDGWWRDSGGRASRIPRDPARTASAVIPTDIKVVVMQRCSSKRRKDFSDLVGVRVPFSHSEMTGSLGAVENPLTLFEALKSFFHLKKSPQIHVDFINNLLSEACFFWCSFRYPVSNGIMQIDRSTEKAIETLHCLKELDEYIREIMEEIFIPLSVKAVL